jgi:signal peptidase II
VRLWWVAAFIGLLLSVSAKVFADLFLRAPLPIFGSWFGLDYALNPGIAFGVLLPHPFQSILIGFAFAAVLWFTHQWLPHPLCCIGVGLIIGGGAANILDRLRDGVVTDFIVLWPFPLFNVADIHITLGALLLIVGEFWPRMSQKALVGLLRKW